MRRRRLGKSVLDDQSAGHAPLPDQFVRESPDQGEDNGVDTRHHHLGPLGGEGENNSRGENEEQERRENEHESVHF